MLQPSIGASSTAASPVGIPPSVPPEPDPDPPPLEPLLLPLAEPLPPPLPLDEPEPLQMHSPSCPLESHGAWPVRLPLHEHTTMVLAGHVTPAGWLLHPAGAAAAIATATHPARLAMRHMTGRLPRRLPVQAGAR
jgi:hypothetical protein